MSSDTILERLSDEFFASLPKCLSISWIQRVASDSFVLNSERHVVRNDVSDVAIFAIPAADLAGVSNHSGPHRSCSSLRNGLQLKWRLTFGCILFVYLVDHFLKTALVHVATQFSVYTTWMYRCGTHATVPVPLVERDGEESVCGLRPAIRDERCIGRPLKVRIFKVDIGKAVTC